MSNFPSRPLNGPDDYRSDWDRWRGEKNVSVMEIKTDVGELKEAVKENAAKSQTAHLQMLDRIGSLENRFAELRAQIGTWGKVLGALVLVAGVALPVALALIGD
jgi:hypothetical protein